MEGREARTSLCTDVMRPQSAKVTCEGLNYDRIISDGKNTAKELWRGSLAIFIRRFWMWFGQNSFGLSQQGTALSLVIHVD